MAATAAILLLVWIWPDPAELGRGPAGAESALQRIETLGIAWIGFANEAPYAYVDTRTRKLTGEAPVIAREVLRGMDVAHIEGVLTEFGSLIPALKAGRFDVIAAGMYITPERCREILFSEPTYAIGEAFIVRADNPLDLRGYEDVRDRPSARLGVVTGAVQLGYARRAGIPDERIVIFPDAPSAVDGVLADRVDAYAGTSLTVNDLLTRASDPRLERARPFKPLVIDGKPIKGYGAYGFRKRDMALRDAFNRELERLIGTERHLALIKPFGFTAEELPGDATTAALCESGP